MSSMPAAIKDQGFFGTFRSYVLIQQQRKSALENFILVTKGSG